MRGCDYCGDATDPDEMCRKCVLLILGVVLVKTAPR